MWPGQGHHESNQRALPGWYNIGIRSYLFLAKLPRPRLARQDAFAPCNRRASSRPRRCYVRVIGISIAQQPPTSRQALVIRRLFSLAFVYWTVNTVRLYSAPLRSARITSLILPGLIQGVPYDPGSSLRFASRCRRHLHELAPYIHPPHTGSDFS